MPASTPTVLHCHAPPASTPEFPGADQINLGPRPCSLAGRQEVNLQLTVAGIRANTVTVAIE